MVYNPCEVIMNSSWIVMNNSWIVHEQYSRTFMLLFMNISRIIHELQMERHFMHFFIHEHSWRYDYSWNQIFMNCSWIFLFMNVHKFMKFIKCDVPFAVHELFVNYVHECYSQNIHDFFFHKILMICMNIGLGAYIVLVFIENDLCFNKG